MIPGNYFFQIDNEYIETRTCSVPLYITLCAFVHFQYICFIVFIKYANTLKSDKFKLPTNKLNWLCTNTYAPIYISFITHSSGGLILRLMNFLSIFDLHLMFRGYLVAPIVKEDY